MSIMDKVRQWLGEEPVANHAVSRTQLTPTLLERLASRRGAETRVRVGDPGPGEATVYSKGATGVMTKWVFRVNDVAKLVAFCKAHDITITKVA